MKDKLKKLIHNPIFLTTFSLLISSFFSVFLLIARMVYSDLPTFGFLVWNLFLAWLPLLFALALNFVPVRKPFIIISVVLFSLWLIFFPNAPYIVTDFIHLRARKDIPLWYDIALITSFSWNGLILGFYSLSIVQNYIRLHLNRIWGWITVFVSLIMASFGIYIGRFLRWNSWDLFYNAPEVLTDVGNIFLNPFENIQTFGVMIIFTAFLFTTYLTIRFFTKIDYVSKK